VPNGSRRSLEALRPLADAVTSARAEFDIALERDRRRWPKMEFARLVKAVRDYTEAADGAELIHRSVAASVSGLREYLEVQGRRVPGSAVAEADRLDTTLFAGYDPHFEGHEPPDL
jgi:hypothetical protein